MEIRDQVAIITGGARGIGRATALALAKAGARAIVIADQKLDLAAETADLVRDAGAEAHVQPTDVGSVDSLRELFRETADRFGALGILHNNAAVGEGADEWPTVDPTRVEAILDVNLRGVVLGTQMALPLMHRGGGGAIVNTASGAAFTPLPPQAVYAASKAGVVHFTRSCAALAKSHGIRVSCVCPGLVETPMIQDSGPDGPWPWLQQVIDAVEMLQPEDIARAVVELVEDPESAGRVVKLENRPRQDR